MEKEQYKLVVDVPTTEQVRQFRESGGERWPSQIISVTNGEVRLRLGPPDTTDAEKKALHERAKRKE